MRKIFILIAPLGHGSHLTYKVVKTAKENQIIVICLPPNTSHALQPCDVSLFRPLKVVWKDILKMWFRETRMQVVDKAVFPSLLNKLWIKLKPENAISGFSGSGLYPIDPMKVKPRIVEANTHEELQTNDNSPRKMLRQAIINAVTPSPSDETRAAMANAKRKRKRVQDKAGEVLTADDVIERLRQEEIQRNAKKALKNRKNKSFVIAASAACSSKKNKKNSKQRKSKENRRKLDFDHSCSESDDASDSVESDDEEDSVPCLSCGKLYGQESAKFRPHWVSCDKCEKWTCVECLPDNFDIDDSFLCTICLV